MEDTIAAISTPIGEGGIGIIRISGGEALPILKHIFKSEAKDIEPSRVYHGWVLNGGGFADEAIAFYLKGPKSYTGEDVVEICCHSGIAILNKILTACIKEGARLAERGEFTKRAFLNGRIDLVQAEAVIDLVKARTAEAASIAVNQLKGSLSQTIRKIKERTLTILAGLEAMIDFPDDIQEKPLPYLKEEVSEIKKEISALILTADRGRIFREGVSTAIVGRPNVGKSSLLNALLREERAIVAPIPGTTRDTIEERVNVRGIPLIIIDTAGLRPPKDSIEELGVKRAKNALSSAELVLAVFDGSEDLTPEDFDVLKEVEGKRTVYVINKKDKKLRFDTVKREPEVKVSALTFSGIEELEEAVSSFILKGEKPPYDSPVVSNMRHKECLVRAKEAIQRVLFSAENRMPIDFLTIDLKDAVCSLSQITGEAVTEEIINKIFESFCVGK